MSHPLWKGWIGSGFTPADFITYVGGIRWQSWRPQFVVVHNTQIPTFAKWHTQPGSRWMDSFIHYYRDDQDWSGGPHLFVADDVIWVGTPLTKPGVHSPSWNGTSFGVEMVGDYETEPLSPAVFQNTASALATLHDALGIDPATLRFHKEDPLTTHKGCPGRNVDKADLVALIKQKLVIRHGGEHLPTRLSA
jgi:hypothetical protein